MEQTDPRPDTALDAALAMCRRGEIAGLAHLYAQYGDKVYRLSRSILGCDADAEDATQEVFLRVFAKADKFDGRAAFTTWLYRLTVNHSLNWRRKLSRLVRVFGHSLEDSRDRSAPHEHSRFAAQLEAKEEVDALLSRLSPDHRTILALREISALDYQEIAAVLAIPVGTVMSRLARARGELLRQVDPDRVPEKTPAVIR